MSGIEAALFIPYGVFVVTLIYTVGIKSELNAYRRNEQAKKEIAQNDSLDGRLIRNSNAYYKID